MEDRSNIIKEAIEYRDKLEKKVEELAQSVVRLQISLDFANNTIKKKDRENAELKAYKDINEDFKTAWEELKAENDRLKSQLDFEVQKKEVLETENERLKEDYIKLSQQKDLDNVRWQKRCTDLHIEDKAKADKYWLVLQEIKEIAEKECKDCLDKRSDSCWICPYYPILDLITKAEEE